MTACLCVACISEFQTKQWYQMLYKQRADLQAYAFAQTWSKTYFLFLTYTQNHIAVSIGDLVFPYTHTSLLVSLSPSVSHTHIHTRTHLHPLLHQWSSHSLPLTSQQAVFHLPQIALVCHPKLCLQSCLPMPLQHIAHLIGLRTPFWICKRRSCIIIRNIQMKDSAVNWHFWMCWEGQWVIVFMYI